MTREDNAAWTAEHDQWMASVREHLRQCNEFFQLAEEAGFNREEAMELLIPYVEAAWRDRE